MTFSRFLRSRRLAAFALLALGCAAAPLRAENLPPAERVDSPTPASARNQAVITETRRLLEKGDIDGLDALANELRKNREQLDGGTWILSTFYDCAVEVPEEYEPGTAAVAFYEKWVRDRPQSLTARVCLASALTSYAWNVRGSGWADSVSEERWRLFRERLARARKVLEDAESQPDRCPGWFAVAQRVALGQGWDRVKYRRLVGDAIRFEPTYGEFYTNTCRWLLPRWYGEPGDFEQWIADEADTYPPAQRDRQYARFVWMADRLRMNSEMVFAPGRLDWARTKRGFAGLLEEKPGNLVVQFEFLSLALLAEDRETAREIFRATGGKYLPSMWSEKRFEDARQFAFAEGPNPLRTSTGTKAEIPSISPEIVAGIKLGLRLASGFFGGLLAGVCLLVIALRRKAAWPGVVALLACLVVATPFGTAATIFPAAFFWLFLRRRPASLPPEIAAPPGWVGLLWMLLFAVLYVGLQFGAALFAGAALGVEFPRAPRDFFEREIFARGTAFLICANAAWITLLALIAVCPPHANDRRRMLALNSCAPRRFFGWVAGPALFLFGLNLLEPWMDARTRAAIGTMALGLASPAIFFVAVAFAAPIVEELIFRGYAISGWMERLRPWGAILASSALFTACHFQYGFTGLIFIFIFGVVLGVVRWRTGSVYPCIAIHLINNLAFGLSLYFQRTG